MTRKDFELIARTISDAYDDYAFSEEARDAIARAFADALANTNPLFDRARFLAACGVEEAS